jgi:ABC-2 type transport system ATP-binding protein
MAPETSQAERRPETTVPRTAAEPVLVATGLTKAYRSGVWPRRTDRPVLSGADLSLWPGEVVGVVGENGCGKSTLLKLLVGALAPDRGVVSRRGVLGYCPQEPVLYERLTCDEHLELFGHGYGMDLGDVARSGGALYEALGFGQYARSRVSELSGGTRAKLNLALALLPDPQVLLLDEPYAGFDWDTYLRFWELVAARREGGAAVLVVSHFVVDQESFDRVVELRDGRAEPR